jgi:exonuclease VII small subunit
MVQGEHAGLLGTLNVLQHGNVLYMDYEASADEVNEHVRLLRNGLGLPGIELAYRRCYVPLADEIEDVQRLVAERDVKLLIVDSLALACGGEPEKTEYVIPLFRALRALGVAVFIIHHVNREGKVYGSAYLKNMARNVWELKKTQEVGSDEVIIGLYHEKVNRGKKLKPIGLRFDYGGVNRAESTGVAVETYDLKDDPDQARNLPMKDRLAEALRRGRMTVKELAEEINEAEDSIRVILNRNKGSLFQPTKEGYWGLSAFHAEEQRW